jgi:DNA replication licensing factor MCM2
MEHLDAYEREGIDEAFEEELSAGAAAGARLAAERELEARDALEGRDARGRRGRLPAALDEGDDEALGRPRRRRRVEDAQAGFGDDADGVEPDVAINLEEPRGPVREFVAQEAVRREVKRQFRRFLLAHADEAGEALYAARLRDMVRANGASLEVDYVDLANRLPQVAIWVADLPGDVLPLLGEAAREAAVAEFEGYAAVAPAVHVRIANIPLQESIRDLRHFHLNQLVRIDGVVTRRTGVHAQLDRVMFDCAKCGALLGPYFQTGDREVRLGACAACLSKGPFTVNARETVYRNYQVGGRVVVGGGRVVGGG